MSDDTTTKSHDELIREAKKSLRQRLTQTPYLLTPDGSRRIVEENAHRLVPFPNGIVQALMPSSNSKFYEMTDTSDPLAAFVCELARNAPDEDRLEAVAQRQQNIAEISDEKAASGQYRM